jgi:hypothetical protein
MNCDWGANLVGGVAVGETLEDRARQGVAVREDERIAEGVGLLKRKRRRVLVLSALWGGQLPAGAPWAV